MKPNPNPKHEHKRIKPNQSYQKYDAYPLPTKL